MSSEIESLKRRAEQAETLAADRLAQMQDDRKQALAWHDALVATLARKEIMDAPTFDNFEFRKGLEHAINYHSMENGSNSPDFVLAQYLADCLAAFDRAVQHREAWYGRQYNNGNAPPPPGTAERLSAS